MLTKTDLQEIRNIVKESQEDLKETLENKITKFKSDILDAVDGVIGNLERKTALSTPPV